ncbi:MAG TPA: hypothetical protein VGO53_08435 [Steroidobacteraceae bacterium]|nr:hypothetical protein [Steroidobacteraceae bacterium]
MSDWYPRPGLFVADIGRSVDFYVNQLGFTVGWRGWAMHLVMASVLTVMSAPCAIGAESLVPGNRAEATKIVADIRRIVTPEGVERLAAWGR